MTPTPQSAPPSSPKLHQFAERLGDLAVLDPPANRLAGVVRKVLKPGTVKDALSGTLLGHPLHPVLTDVPIGAWTSATILDLIGGRDSQRAADLLVGTGILAALPTAASGYSDWSDTIISNPRVRRIGLVHAAANVGALALFSASLLARRRGRRGRGVALGLSAMGTVGLGGYLGGHLSFAEGVGVNQTAFEEGPAEWTPAAPETEVPEGTMVSVEAGGATVLLARDSGQLFALSNRCTHRGAPLDQGELSDGCVTCPWHGSRFSLRDGSVRRGPASIPEPTFETRVVAGTIELRALRPAAS